MATRPPPEQLWDTYFLRMVEVARLEAPRHPDRMADEEDVALSAFKSFCRGDPRRPISATAGA